jgi:biotin carboxylase
VLETTLSEKGHPVISTLLVANRGEIALRVIRTAQATGLRTVAVYSDADREAPHVRAADIAVRIGPTPAGQSYLDIDAILEAARRTGAFAAAARPMPSTRRVSTGSMMPSSHSRAVE